MLISGNLFAVLAIAVVFVGGYLWFRPGRRPEKTPEQQVGMNSKHPH